MTSICRFVLAGAAACFFTGCSGLEPALGPLEDDEGGTSVLTTDAGADGGLVDFARDIRPLMNRSDTDPTGHGCAYCHYPGQGSMQGLMMGKLDLSTLGQLRKGGATSGSGIINVANPEQSAIVEKLKGTYFEGDRMPKSGPPYWSDDEIQLVVTWISQGALGADTE